MLSAHLDAQSRREQVCDFYCVSDLERPRAQLRHTAASLALQAGVPLKAVSAQQGHSSLAITADTYTSVLSAVAKRRPGRGRHRPAGESSPAGSGAAA